METKCSYCGKKIIIRNRWRIKRTKNFYCSNKCKGIGVNKNNKNGKHIKCLFCKKPFYISRSRFGKKLFCSNNCFYTYSKGRMPKNIKGLELGRGWNKGKKRWWDNPNAFQKGHKPPWTGKKRLNMTGKNHWNWKGGYYKSETCKLRHSLEYKLWRKAVYERDKYTCQWCREVGKRLEADHIQEWILRPDLRFAIDNGRTLCRKCHLKRHFSQCKRTIDMGL